MRASSGIALPDLMMAGQKRDTEMATTLSVKEEEQMYILKVWDGQCWSWGIRRYATLPEAKARVNRLRQVGIRAKVFLATEVFGKEKQ